MTAPNLPRAAAPRRSARSVATLTALVVLATTIPATTQGQTARPDIGFAVPQWAFPTSAPAPTPVFDSVTKHQIPGSTRRYTKAQSQNGFDVIDWFPGTHPAPPRPVMAGGAPVWRACGFCHLPDGQGRPENATLAGLPAEYIRAQVAAFADSSRLVANPMSTTNSMHQIAANAPVGDVRVASEYFSRRQLHRRNRIVESAQVPTTRIAGILYARDGSGTEALNGRLIEIPESLERHELHDPTGRYITYVPPGSLARGRRLVQTGPAGPTTACSACHGPDLLGVAMVPPIAGRSPSYILRQLLNIKTGARRDSASVPMRAVVEPLSLDDIVALAAYVGSLAPNRPR